MIVKSWFGRGLEWKIGGCVALVAVLSIGVSDRVLAQIVPDNTLGAEGSVVTPNVSIQGIPSDRIDGGATRGANLFHSFGKFNVGEGRGVYFANPVGIENILTRVTGSNASNILGRLGVLGGANLFLLNPNGIVFGANASLDIKGSFVATTGDRIQLGNSGYLSAAEPQTSSLLSVSPGALFFSQVANQPTAIINQGNLSTGKHLTLSAGNLELQGQLQAGGDLTLQAQDTVKVRDSVGTPFLALSSGNLTIQGNGGIDIYALNHLTSTPFVSGGNLSLVSDGLISTDAHFASGGDFSIRTLGGLAGSFRSLKDPIFTVGGNYSVGDYTGASLQVSVGGNIDYGTVVINAVDPSVHPTNPALFLNAGETITGTGDVSTTVAGGGLLVDFQAGGNISTQGITTFGGRINLNSTEGTIIANGILNSSSTGFGNGGDINITAMAGSIFFRDGTQLNASTVGQGNAGNVNINARDTVSFDGIVTFDSDGRPIANGGVRSTVEKGAVGNGGNISITAGSVSVTDGAQILARNYAGQGNAGSVTIKATDTVELAGFKGNSDATVGSDVAGGGIGNGNDVNITARSVFIKDQAIVAASIINGRGENGNPAQAGNVNITATDTVSVSDSTVLSEVGTNSIGNGGTIKIVDTPKVVLENGASLITQIRAGGKGSGGDIDIETGSLSVTGGSQLVTSTSGRGNAGNITIEASDTVSFDGVGSNRFGRNVFVNNIYSSAAYSTVEEGAVGNGGDINITASKIRLFGDSDITTFVAQGAGGGGNIKLTANSIIAFGDSDILAYADRNDGGKGGKITLDTRAFFGENYSPASSRKDPPNTLDGNNRVDVNATGAINGVITLPDVSFIQNSLTELPENQINTDSLLANSCIVRRNQPTKGTFTITGTGGLPQRPGDAQMSSFPTVDVKTLPSDSTLSNTNPNPSWQKSDPIVEPQGVYRLPNGKLVLSQECS